MTMQNYSRTRATPTRRLWTFRARLALIARGMRGQNGAGKST